MLNPILKTLKNGGDNLYFYWRDYFWTKPDNLWALKVTLATAIVLIPTIGINEPFLGITLALGIIGAALSEVDDHPKGRLKTSLFTILSFLIVTIAVELLRPYPIIFIGGFALTTITLIIMGSISYRYQGITFGALLISIYAMLGTGIKPWYYQPILLPLGGGIYSTISITLLYLHPYRLLEEQISRSFQSLSNYLNLKATLFLSPPQKHKQIRIELAQQNISVERSIDSTMRLLSSIKTNIDVSLQTLEVISPYYHKWLLLQQLHERATSSHQPYELLFSELELKPLSQGFSKLLEEIGEALKIYASSLLSENYFIYPQSLDWTVRAVGEQVKSYTYHQEYSTLNLLYQNLACMCSLLKEINQVEHHSDLGHLPKESHFSLQALLKLFNSNSSRFRHAIRLTVCFVLGYTLQELLQIPKGEWIILTTLFVCQQSYTATRQRLFERIGGTILGVILGIFLSSLLPTDTGQIILLLTAIFIFFFQLRKRYYIAVIFITIFVIAGFNLQSNIDITILWSRLLCTLIGATIAFGAVRYLWPDWSYRNLPTLIEQAILQNKEYFEVIYLGKIRGYEYYNYRRLAHSADNNLASAWSGMSIEPKNKRFLQKQAFAITYLNHSLLSYISALGAHYYTTKLTQKEQDICRQISQMFNYSVGSRKISQIQIQEYKVWLKNLEYETKDTEHISLRLLYNIAYTTYDLLRKRSKLY